LPIISNHHNAVSEDKYVDCPVTLYALVHRNPSGDGRSARSQAEPSTPATEDPTVALPVAEEIPNESNTSSLVPVPELETLILQVLVSVPSQTSVRKLKEERS
jgi:hypothetical protein